MEIVSTAFTHGAKIPSQYSFDGGNENPPLAFSNVPAGTQSLALIMYDPDVPLNVRPDGNFDHWVIFNIPANTKEIAAGSINIPGIHGANSRGASQYTGPRPPDREHRYFFVLYALDSLLNLNEGATRREVEKAMMGHILTTATLMGLYAPTS